MRSCSHLAKRLLPGAALVSIVVWLVVVARGADADGTTSGATPEPILGEASWPNPGSETGPLRPFDMPPEAAGAIPIEDMSPDEQAVIERGFDQPNMPAIHAAYAAATQQAAERAAAEAAANAAGLEGLAGAGVVAP